MAAEIIEESASLFGCAKLAPGTQTRCCPVAIIARLKACDRTEHVCRNQLAHGQKVIVPAPILEDGEQLSCLFARLNQSLSVSDRSSHRLIDDDGKPGIHSGKAKRHMSTVRCCYHN